MTTDPQLAAVVDAAVADLTGRLGVPRADVALLRAEEVTWPDASLGCPGPGRSYAPAPVTGFRVLLRHGERVHLYHAGGDGAPFLCPSGDGDGGHDFVPPPGIDV